VVDLSGHCSSPPTQPKRGDRNCSKQTPPPTPTSSPHAPHARPPPKPLPPHRPPNTTGIVKAAPFLEMTEADFDAVISVNLKGVFLTCQAAAQAMVRRGRGGSIVCMSSVNGSMAIPTIAGYNASKGAWVLVVVGGVVGSLLCVCVCVCVCV